VYGNIKNVGIEVLTAVVMKKFPRNMSPPSSGSNNKPNKKPAFLCVEFGSFLACPRGILFTLGVKLDQRTKEVASYFV
jgi:hypothetical protein